MLRSFLYHLIFFRLKYSKLLRYFSTAQIGHRMQVNDEAVDTFLIHG